MLSYSRRPRLAERGNCVCVCARVLEFARVRVMPIAHARTRTHEAFERPGLQRLIFALNACTHSREHALENAHTRAYTVYTPLNTHTRTRTLGHMHTLHPPHIGWENVKLYPDLVSFW